MTEARSDFFIRSGPSIPARGERARLDGDGAGAGEAFGEMLRAAHDGGDKGEAGEALSEKAEAGVSQAETDTAKTGEERSSEADREDRDSGTKASDALLQKLMLAMTAGDVPASSANTTDTANATNDHSAPSKGEGRPAGLGAGAGASAVAARLMAEVGRVLAGGEPIDGSKQGIAASTSKASATPEASPAETSPMARLGRMSGMTDEQAKRIASILGTAAGSTEAASPGAGSGRTTRADFVSMRTHFEPETLASSRGAKTGEAAAAATPLQDKAASHGSAAATTRVGGETVNRADLIRGGQPVAPTQPSRAQVDDTAATGRTQSPNPTQPQAQSQNQTLSQAASAGGHRVGEGQQPHLPTMDGSARAPRAGEDAGFGPSTSKSTGGPAGPAGADISASVPAAAGAAASGSVSSQAASAIGRELGALNQQRSDETGRYHLRAGGSAMKSIQIKLQPASMGTLDVSMQLSNGQLTIKLVANQADTAMRLSENTRELRTLLQSAGFQVDDAAITVHARDATHAAHRLAGAGGPDGQQPSQPQNHAGTNAGSQQSGGGTGRDAGQAGSGEGRSGGGRSRNEGQAPSRAQPAAVGGGEAENADIYL